MKRKISDFWIYLNLLFRPIISVVFFSQPTANINGSKVQEESTSITRLDRRY
jgi:hypothetical protein